MKPKKQKHIDEQKKIRVIHKVLMALLVSLIFCGMLWNKTIKPILWDTNVIHQHNVGWQKIKSLTLSDPEGDSCYVKILEVLPTHEFKVTKDSVGESWTLWMNREGVNAQSAFAVTVGVFDKEGNGTKVGWVFHSFDLAN